MISSSLQHTSYQVQSLEPNNEYVFRVSAANKHGFGPPGSVSDAIVTVVRHFSSFHELGESTPNSASAAKSRPHNRASVYWSVASS